MLHLKREYTHIVYLRIRIHEPSLSVTCSLHSKSLVADNTLATRRSIKTHEKTVANATNQPNITGGNYVQTHQMSHVVNE